MRQNAIWLWILALVAMTAAMTGCGGSNAPFRGETPFVGSWAGNWSVVGSADVGVMTMTVGKDATLRGSFTNTGTGETGRIVGATHPDGLFNATFIVDGTGEQIAITGTMVLQGDTEFLAGDAVFTRPGTAGRGMTFNLGTSQTQNPLAGSFGATWQVFDLLQDGIMNVTINTNGVISGQFGNIDTGETGIVTGTVQNNGHFDMFFIPTGGGARITVSGEMVRAGSDPPEWQGAGTYQREGGPVLGFDFTSEEPPAG